MSKGYRGSWGSELPGDKEAGAPFAPVEWATDEGQAYGERRIAYRELGRLIVTLRTDLAHGMSNEGLTATGDELWACYLSIRRAFE